VPERPLYPAIPNCAISPRESDLLADLTAGGYVLEIGSWHGYSAIWMALNGARVDAVDPHTMSDTALSMAANVTRYGVGNRVTIIVTRSQDAVLPPVLYDACFIDGDHSYDAASFDLRLARRVVRPGGWIIAHDYAYPGYNFGGCPEVVRAVDEILGDLREVRREHWMYAARLPVSA
jgi:predicted O-methyltransferase YrrM